MQNYNVAASNTTPIIPHFAEHNEILKPVDAAVYLQLSASSLAKLRLYGTGPRYTKAGRAVRYRRSDLDAWINARYADSTTDADYRLPKRLADPTDPQPNGGQKNQQASVH
jgi:predicted DNA-binding transcriptional regulator AlpA